MIKHIILTSLLISAMSQIIVQTQVYDQNVTIFKDGSVIPQFSESQTHESTCHPSLLFIEGHEPTEREFYITNTGNHEEVFRLDHHELRLQKNETGKITHKYQLCTTNFYHERIEIRYADTQDLFVYIKMCKQLEAPAHPVFVLLLVSFIMVYVGTIYGQNSMKIFGEEQAERVDTKAAVYFLLISSGGLLTLYFLEQYIQILLLVWILVVGFMASQNLLNDIAEYFRFENGFEINLPYIGKVTQNELQNSLFSLGLVILYSLTKNWILSNMLAIALTLMLFKLFEIDSLRTATLLLCLAFFYDVFWVFYSPYIFGRSVMAQVATSVDLPMKFQCPEFLTHIYPVARCSLIGLGDIILPGIFLKYLYRCDKHLGKFRLFPAAYAGYIVGLTVCMYFLLVFQLAQPALLYLVPGTLIPTFYCTWKYNTFKYVWEGDMESTKNKPKMIHQVDQDYELTADSL